MMNANLLDFPDDADIIIDNGPAIIQKGKNRLEVNPCFFAAKMKKLFNLIYFRSNGWFEWADNGWEPVRKCTLQGRIRDLLKDEVRNAGKKQKSLIPLLKNASYSTDPAYDLVNTGNINEILRLLILECNQGETLPPLDPNAIPLRNKILNWDVEEAKFIARDYEPGDMIFCKLDAEYDDQVKAMIEKLDGNEKKASPSDSGSNLFLKKIAEILPKDDDRRVVQEYMGAALFPENRTRKFMLFQGEGGCGKSLLQKLLTSILTVDRTFDLNFDSIRQNFSFSALTTQTLLSASEAASKAFQDSSCSEFVKKCVGGDFFQTEQKYQNLKYNHYGFFSLLIVSNNSLRFQYDGRGEEFKDRLIPILFEHHFDASEQDKELATKLLNNHKSDILVWLLEGARRVRLNNWNIQMSPSQISRRDKIVEATRGIELFVRNHIIREKFGSFSSQAAYDAYIKLQDDVGFEYLTERQFQHRLHKAMADIYRATPCNTVHENPKDKNTVRGYHGFRLETTETVEKNIKD